MDNSDKRVTIRFNNEELKELGLNNSVNSTIIKDILRRSVKGQEVNRDECEDWFINRYVKQLEDNIIPNMEIFFPLLKFLVESGFWKKMENGLGESKKKYISEMMAKVPQIVND